MVGSKSDITQVTQWLFDLLQGPVRWQLLDAGLSLGVLELLATPNTADKIAQELGFLPAVTGTLLNALVAMQLLDKQGQYFQLKTEFVRCLLTDSEKSLKPVLLHLSRLRHTSVEDIHACLTGESRQHQATQLDQAQFWVRACGHLQAFHRSCATDVALATLQPLINQVKAHSVLDLGAGSSHLGLSLCQANPELVYTLFDLPECIAEIEASLSATERQGLQFSAGDYNQHPLPKGHDLVWASMSLYYARDLAALMADIKHSLNPGGVFVSLHEGLTHERTLPAEHVINRSLPAMSGNDVSFEYGQIANLMFEAGFKRIVSRSVDTPYGQLELDLAYV